LAPPTNKLRLSNLDMDHVGLEIARAAAVRMSQLSALLAPSWGVREPKGVDDQLRKTALYEAVQRLGAYAKTGEPLSEPFDELLVLLLPLHVAMLDIAASVQAFEDVEPTTPFGLLVCVARARHKVEKAAEPLSAIELGALVELDPNQVRGLANAEEIPGAERREDDKRRPFYFQPRPLKKWLRMRGVAGF
jgi:hypothetical protein